MVDEKEAVLFARKYLKTKSRYLHSVGVASSSWVIADFVGFDASKARIAGMLHDVARELDLEKQRELARDVVDVDDVPTPLLHQFAGGVLVQREFADDPEIVEAVMYHATGKKGAGTLTKIVFVADFVDTFRYVCGSEKLMQKFVSGIVSFDDLVVEVAKRKVRFVKESGEKIYPAVLDFLAENNDGL